MSKYHEEYSRRHKVELRLPGVPDVRRHAE